MKRRNFAMFVVSLLAITFLSLGKAGATSSMSSPLKVWNKTTGVQLMGDWEVHGSIGQNIIFAPNMMSDTAHHYTLKMVDMSNGQIVYYKTMTSRWSMENPRQDGSLGWTTWKKGTYWLQVDGYNAQGVPLGWTHTILHVGDNLSM